MKSTLKITLLLMLLLVSCVERRINILSDPLGATVVVDGEERGQTPLELDFDFYGTREITLIKEGYQTTSHLEKIEAPFYQWFPLDFFAEVVNPFTIRDTHNLYYALKPHLPLKKEEKESLLKRAEKLRATHSSQE